MSKTNNIFINELLNNWPIRLFCFLIISIFLIVIQNFILKKNIIMSIIHSILVSALITI